MFQENYNAFVASQIYLNVTLDMDLNANLKKHQKKVVVSIPEDLCVSVDTTEGYSLRNRRICGVKWCANRGCPLSWSC